jgi:phospholipase/carboxylesterase
MPAVVCRYTGAVTSTTINVRTVGALAPGGLTVILLHGFGAPGDDLVDLAKYIAAPKGTCFHFPHAPIELGGIYGDARAWWMIDPRAFERVPPPDLSRHVPEGLVEARALITGIVHKVIDAGAGPIVLGGFSQGAMLSLDTALHLDERAAKHLAGLALMSGTRINRDAWAPRLARLRGVPILMSHGYQDPLLPYEVAVELRDDLRAAGAVVEWVEFDGGHQIPPPVLTAVAKVLAAAGQRGLAAEGS